MEPPQFESASVGPVSARRRDLAFAPGNDPAPPSLRLRRFRPPFHADVEVRDSQPVFVASLKLNGPITQTAGPWHSSGHWWESDQLWNRAAWDIQTPDGALYRIFCERDDWFVEGVYD
jgi:hypothetical protein